MPPRSAPVLRALLWLALGGWLGASFLFVGAVAPAAFSVTPSTEVAGNLVSRILPAVHYAGAFAGLVVAALGWTLGRRRALPLVLALGLAGICLASEWMVSPAIAELRPAIRTPEPDPALRARFGRLHGLSVGLLGASLVAATALAALHARADWREAR